MHVTDYILSKTNKLVKQPEVSPGDHGFSMFNDGGVEVEVAEFLYGLVRMVKPLFVLETGTHLGISAAYMGLACRENDRGMVVSCEIDPGCKQSAERLWQDIGLSVGSGQIVECILAQSLNLDCIHPINLLFLDSEPELRFDEFVKFWPAVSPGGLIIIHDLHPHLGHEGHTHNGMYDWPYGDFRQKIGSYILSHEVQTFSFTTPRGLALFQKAASNFGATNYLLGKLND